MLSTNPIDWTTGELLLVHYSYFKSWSVSAGVKTKGILEFMLFPLARPLEYEKERVKINLHKQSTVNTWKVFGSYDTDVLTKRQYLNYLDTVGYLRGNGEITEP